MRYNTLMDSIKGEQTKNPLFSRRVRKKVLRVKYAFVGIEVDEDTKSRTLDWGR